MKSDPLWFFLAESFVWHNLFEVYSSAFLLVNSILFMNVSHFIYQSPADEHLDHFKVWAIMESGAINICLHFFVWRYAFISPMSFSSFHCS